MDLFHLSPQLCGCILFAPPEARAMFLHNDLPFNDTCSVIGGSTTYWGGGGHKRKKKIRTYMRERNSFGQSVHFGLSMHDNAAHQSNLVLKSRAPDLVMPSLFYAQI